MDYSKSFKTECRKAAIDIQEKIMADLMIMGWRDTNAYIAAYGYNINYTDQYNKEQIEKIVSRPEFKKYMDRTRKRISKQNDDDDDDLDFDISSISKEETLKDLYLAKKKAPRGSKEWLDIQKQIIEVTQMKKDEVKDEDNTIHYYLPLSCHNCELYNAHQKKVKKS